jgi:hypothetical protein
MRYVTFIVRILLVVVAVATLYVGVVQGEWGETMFNATLL